MGEVDAKGERVTRRDLRHDRHTVSLLTDHLVFCIFAEVSREATGK